jgi:hypothetical protein
MQHERVRLQPILDHLHGAVEVGADAVHLVDEAHAGHVVLVGLTPHGLGLRLDAGDRVEHGDRTVEHAERALDLDREVDVARRVDDVDAVVVPDTSGGSGGDRDATLLLLRHVVHGRGAVVDLADLVALARVVEDALGRGGLAGVDVRHDPDVPGALQGELSLGHLLLHFRVKGRLGGCRAARRWRRHEVRVYRSSGRPHLDVTGVSARPIGATRPEASSCQQLATTSLSTVSPP